MRGVSYLAIKHKKVILFIAVALVLLGLYNYYIIPKQESPDLSLPVTMITAIYPGASPEEMESLVTNKIEEELIDIKGYDYSESTTKEGLSVVFVVLTRDVDLNESWQELRRKMEDLQSELPDGCQDIEIDSDLMKTAGIIISMSGEDYTYGELNSYAEDVKKELSSINGISKFEITGEQQRDVKIEIDYPKLNYYNLSLDDLTNIIISQNIDIPSGNLKDGEANLKVNTRGSYESIDEIRNTIIGVSQKTGAIITLKDVSKIYMDYGEYDFKVKHNGRNALLLTGYFKEKENVVLVGKDVREKIEAVKEKLPSNIEFQEVVFQPRDVRESVNDFSINLLQGVIFVIIVVFIGMGFRNAIIVSTAIPLSILMTFSIMSFFDIRIHQVSIAALIIALGMLVDNAIVVSDAIQVRIDDEEERLKACVNGVKEVAIPILTSTLTTIGAFLPLFPLKSDAGEYIRSIPQIITISLSSSYLVALFITPTMAFLFFKKSNGIKKEYKIKAIFDNLLKKAINHRAITVAIILISIGFTGVLTNLLGLQFFPKADKNIIYIDINSEHSSNLDKTEELVNTVEELISGDEEVISYTSAIGGRLPKFYSTMMPGAQSKDFAQIMMEVDLKRGKRFDSNTKFIEYLQQKFDSNISGGKVVAKELELAEPIGNPIRIRVLGEDLNKLGQVSSEIENILRSIEGTINVDSDYPDKIYEYYVDVDINKASTIGISKYDVQNEVNIALMGRKASVFRNYGEEHDIIIKTNITSKEELENLMIKSSITGKKILLKAIADIRLEPQIPRIQKYNGEKNIMVYSDVISGYNSVKIQEELRNILGNIETNGVRIEFDGEEEQISENFGDVGVSALFAILTIYCILLVQFNSFIQPFIILVTIPLSAIGSIFGLFLFKQPLSFMGLLGIVSLFGIVVNNAIVLIDYINIARNEGKSIQEACVEAVDRRFRPIILSTITTVIGLTPLAFSGTTLFTPMAISLMSGLIIATLLTLVIIPVVYSIIESKVKKLKNTCFFSLI